MIFYYEVEDKLSINTRFIEEWPRSKLRLIGEDAQVLEGVSTTIPYKGSVDQILSDLARNVRSGFSYTGARSVKEFRNKVKMIRQTQAGMRESFTHILLK